MRGRLAGFRLERDLQRHVNRSLEDAGAKIFKIVGSMMQRSGWPDTYVAAHLWTGWLELKVDGRGLEPLQRIVLRELSMRKVNAYVMRHVSDGRLTQIEDHDGEVLLESVDIDDGRTLLRQLALISRTRGL